MNHPMHKNEPIKMRYILSVTMLIFCLQFCSLSVYGIGYDNFELFGVDQMGNPVDIAILEDSDSPIRKADQIVALKAIFSINKTSETIDGGHCKLEFGNPFQIECDTGKGLLSGSLYKGHKVFGSKRVEKIINIYKVPKVNKVFKDFLLKKMRDVKNSGGESTIDSYFECIRSCNESVPKILILMWFGD